MALSRLKTILRLITVEPIVFLYLFTNFLELNAIQSIFLTKICLNVNNPEFKSDCMKKHNFTSLNITSEVAAWDQYYSACTYVCTFLMGFYVASWSDYLGRKTVMLIPAIGTFVASSINLLLSLFIETHIAYFLISACVTGLSFGLVGIVASCFGYLSDLVSETSATKRIVILEAMLFVGGTMGSYTAALILQKSDLDVFFNSYAVVFTVELVASFVIILYVVFRIENSRPVRAKDIVNARTTLCCELFNLEYLKDALRTITKSRPSGKRQKIILLMLILSIIYVAITAQFRIAFLYTNSQLDWTIGDFSHYITIQFALKGAGLLVGLPLVLHYWHVPDAVIVVIALLSRFIEYALFGFSRNFAMIFACIPFSIGSEFAVPTIRSMLAKLVDADEKGRIFAFTSILQNFCFCVGSVALLSVFQLSLKLPSPGPGLPFEILALLQWLGIGIICCLQFSSKDGTSYTRVRNYGTTTPMTVE